MHHAPPACVAHPTQLVLFRDTGPWWSASAGADAWRDPNPTDPGRVAALERLSLWWRVNELLAADRVRLSHAREVALRELALVYSSNPATAKKVTTEVVRFLRYADACGVEFIDELTARHVEEFVWSAVRSHGRFVDVSATTAANRQSFLRRFFQVMTEMGIWTSPDPVGRPIAREAGESSRPLTAAELHRLHVYADPGLFRTRRPLLIAMAEAGADAAETALARAGDVDLARGTMTLRGPQSRVNALSEWGRAVMARFADVADHRPDDLLCVTPGVPLERAAQSVTVRLREALADAGFQRMPGVTPRSIRLTFAARVLRADGIEAAARFLGNGSLDVTAKALGHDWCER